MHHPALIPTSLLTVLLLAGMAVPSQAQLPRSQSASAIAQATTATSQTPLLTLQDLPRGFKLVPPADLAELSQGLTEGKYPAQQLFAFQEDEHFEYVMGFTTELPTQLEQAAFDEEIQKPEFLAEFAKGFKEGAENVEVSQEAPLTQLGGIGEAIAGLGFLSNIETIPLRVEVVAFRRGAVGAFVWVMYLEGDQPVMPIEQVVKKLDRRLSEF